MARFYGAIGFSDVFESAPGVWDEPITVRPYYGDLIRNTRLLQNSGEVNDNINVANQVSIVADPYAINNIYSMRYVEFAGAKWKIGRAHV